MVTVQTRPKIPRPYPGRTQNLPTKKEAVTAEWLTAVLQNRHPGVVVESMEELQFVDTHTSKIRMKLEFNAVGRNAGIPQQLCLKSNFSGGFDDVDICQLEAQFYHFLRDKITAPTPQCYYADWDDDGSGRGVVILEDLTLRGGRFGYSLDKAGVDGVAKALEGMAQMHADLWNSPLLDQPWLPVSMATPIDNDQIRIMQAWIDINLAKPDFRAVLPQHYLDDPSKLQRAFDALAEWESTRKHPYCINLGDCHQGNTYILPNGERMWLDWQLVRKGRPWRDLTYFTIGTLTVEERRASERDLLKHYREALVARGVPGVPSLDEIFEQYRRWGVYGIQAWVAGMDNWGQIALPMNIRFFTACEDLETWKLLLD